LWETAELEALRCVQGNYVYSPTEYGTFAYASGEGAKWHLAEELLKQSDHAMDLLRSALHGELAGTAPTVAELWRLEGV
jgi:hypothetical protein